MTIMVCILNEPARVALTAAAIRAVVRKAGAMAAVTQIAGRMNTAPDWMEGRYRGNPVARDELTLLLMGIGHATMTRPADEADRKRARESLAEHLLLYYLEALDEHEAELAKVQAGLAEHLRPKPAPAPAADPPAPAPVTPLPAGGLRDLFTGETRLPVYPDEPREKREPQRRLF